MNNLWSTDVVKSMLLLGTAREGSTRVENKMTRIIYKGKSLFDLYLDKLKIISKYRSPFDDVILAIYPGDKILWEKAKKSGINLVKRNKNSITGIKPRNEELHFLKERDEDYVTWVNACLPFLKPETIIISSEIFKYEPRYKSMTSVIPRFNWFWDEKTLKPINNKNPKIVSTQNSPPVYESVHAFHIFNRKHLLKTGTYWNLKKLDPMLYPLDTERECIDVDTELDFLKCKGVFK